LLDAFLDEPLGVAGCFTLARFLGADLPFGAGLAVAFLATTFLPLGTGVAAHTASAVLNARTITMAIERKRLVLKPA
jgi:hypothetical protein